MKKQPANITEADLLAILNDLPETDQVHFDSSVLSFIETFKLKQGKDKVTKKQLFILYKLWNKGTEKITQYSFTVEMGKYFKADSHFVYLNSNFFNISEYIEAEKKKHKLDRSKSKYWHNHFGAFLKDTKLREGTIYIETEILYYLYTEWTRHSRKKVLLSRNYFYKILDIHFDLKSISDGKDLWVGLNRQIKKLISKKEIHLWRKTRDQKSKDKHTPEKEWKKFALYWQKKDE